MRFKFFNQWDRKDYYNFDILCIGIYDDYLTFDLNIILFGLGLEIEFWKKAPVGKTNISGDKK